MAAKNLQAKKVGFDLINESIGSDLNLEFERVGRKTSTGKIPLQFTGSDGSTYYVWHHQMTEVLEETEEGFSLKAGTTVLKDGTVIVGGSNFSIRDSFQ